jgi:hypothetical protein
MHYRRGSKSLLAETRGERQPRAYVPLRVPAAGRSRNARHLRRRRRFPLEGEANNYWGPQSGASAISLLIFTPLERGHRTTRRPERRGASVLRDQGEKCCGYLKIHRGNLLSFNVRRHVSKSMSKKKGIELHHMADALQVEQENQFSLTYRCISMGGFG